MNKPNRHPTGETEIRALVPFAGPVPVNTFGGRVHVEWDPQAAVTPLGQLPFFTEFLQVSGLFDPWVATCPLFLTSPNAPSKRDVLGTAVLAILSGHQRYAHTSALRGDTVNPPCWGCARSSARIRYGAILASWTKSKASPGSRIISAIA
jgi:hypothetical protein